MKSGMKRGHETHRQHGFTLVELMIVVVIIGILAAISIPAYRTYSLKAKRAEAMSALIDVAGEQEKFYAQNLRYAATIDSLAAYTANPYVPGKGYYNVTVTGSSSGYTITAAAQGTQTEDTVCTSMVITSTGLKTPIACW